MRTYSSRPCRPAPAGPNSTAGVPGAPEDRRIGPERHAGGRRVEAAVAEHLPQRPADRVIAGDFVRRTCHHLPRRAVEIRVVSAELPEGGQDFPQPRVRRLAGHRAPLEVEHAAVRVDAVGLPAVDGRGVERRTAEQRMRRAGLERRVNGFEARQDSSHVQDGVASIRGTAAMRRVAARVDLDPLETLVRNGDAQVGRLGHHGAVGRVRGRKQLRAGAGMLLVGHRRNHQPSGRESSAACDGRGRVHHRGHAALHVLAAAPVEPAVTFDRIERRLHAGDADRIHVAAEHQRAPAGAALDDADDVGAAGRGVGHLDSDAGRAQLGGDPPGERGFTRAPGFQGRIDGIDGDQVAQQPDGGVQRGSSDTPFRRGVYSGNASAMSSGTRPPPTVSAMYCRPSSMYVIGVPIAPPGRSVEASSAPVALS